MEDDGRSFNRPGLLQNYRGTIREPTAISDDLLLKVFFVVDTGGRDSDMSMLSYSYTLLYQLDIEIVAYHLHPETPDSADFPHVHFGPASARPDSVVRPGELHKVHFPTGIVTLQDIIRLAIVEFGVEPRRA